MAVFLNRGDLTLPDAVAADLRQISAGEGVLDFNTNVNDPFTSEITFGLTRLSPISAQLDQLFHVGVPIILTGLSSDSEDPTAPTNVIAGNGVTFEAGGVIHVAYDVGQCRGTGIFTIGQDNRAIPTPNAVILYHELAHALRFAQGKHSDSEAEEERAAEEQENQMRLKLGLPLRDVSNHFGGCGIISGGGGGGGDRPIPVVRCVAVPKSWTVDNHIDVSWDGGANYDFYLLKFGPAGGNPPQGETDFGGSSGFFRFVPTVPGQTYSAQVDGCFSGVFDSKCSGFSEPVRITASENLHSLLAFCKLSGIDPSQGVFNTFQQGPFAVSIRSILGV